MKQIFPITCALFAVLAGGARAGTIIDLNSTSTALDPNQYNNLGNNVLITPHPAWNPNGAGLWISYADTGYNGSVSPDNANPPLTGDNATAIFYLDFYLPNQNNTGSLSVWADDTASVYLDSTLLIGANPVQGSACADAPVSCGPGNGASFALTGLAQGEHRLEFDAYQRGGGPFGVQYQGSIDSSGAPEPVTFVLLGAGLAAMYWLRRRRALATARYFKGPSLSSGQ